MTGEPERQPLMDFDQLLTVAGRLLLAFALAAPVAWEREKSTRIMGLRTFPLVALASCAYILIADSFTDPEDADARARALQGLMTGIGFLGAGAILKRAETVRGTATAASVWTTGAIGAAVGFAEYSVAVMLALFNYGVLLLLTPLEKWMGTHDEKSREERAPAGDRAETTARER